MHDTLELIHAASQTSAAITASQVQPIFPATPPANISANLPHILAALSAAHLDDTPMLLMALATIRAEAECFLPLTEQQSPYNTSPNGHPFDLYDHRNDLGNQGPPDGASFRGRGFVQLTGRANYTRYAQELALDLVATPSLAAQPATAAAPSPPTTSPTPAGWSTEAPTVSPALPPHSSLAPASSHLIRIEAS
jgi:putative chitinase